MKPASISITKNFSTDELRKHLFLVVTEATRTPPHIGLMVNGAYSSLTVKGKEKNIDCGVMLKNIQLRKIPSLFIRLKDHPVFSFGYLQELLLECMSDFHRVEADGTTCLSPVKHFLKEGYQLCPDHYNFLFELVPLLEENNLIADAEGFNLDQRTNFIFPQYTLSEINERIQRIRMEFQN